MARGWVVDVDARLTDEVPCLSGLSLEPWTSEKAAMLFPLKFIAQAAIRPSLHRASGR